LPSAAVSKNFKYTDVIVFFLGFREVTGPGLSEQPSPIFTGSMFEMSATSITAF